MNTKGTVKVEIEIPVEYDNEETKQKLLDDLKKWFNRNNNKTEISLFSSTGCYSWHLPNKNAKVEFINK